MVMVPCRFKTDVTRKSWVWNQ